MRNGLLTCAALLVGLSGAAGAVGLEESVGQAQLSFLRVVGGFRLPVFKRPLAAPKEGAKAAAVPDFKAMFESPNAVKPTEEDLTGWLSGRRVTKKGWAAALLVGTDVDDDPEAGPIAGKTFKAFIFGYSAKAPDEGITPADLYRRPGSETINTVTTIIREDNSQWSAPEFKDKEREAVATRTFKEAADEGEKTVVLTFELRRYGSFIVGKFPDGSYGYFSKAK